MLRRFAPAGIALALIASLGFAVSAQSDPATGTQVPTLAEFNALEARVTAAQDKNAVQDNRLDALEATPEPTPTPDPTPTPTPDPTPAPSGDFPSASTTGVPAGTTLTDYTGPATISTANTVLSGKRFGCITVTAPGVVIRNSTFTCSPSYAVIEVPDRGFTGTPLLLEDVEISCQGAGIAVGEAHYTLHRANIHDCENGLDVNQQVTIEDSFIHNLYNGNDAHADGIQLASRWNGVTYIQGAKDVVVRHNTIYSADASGALGTSALISNPKGDENILIENNLLAGGAFTLYCPVDVKGVNYSVLDNHFSTKFSSTVGAFGASTGCSDETKSGNVFHETGAAINLD